MRSRVYAFGLAFSLALAPAALHAAPGAGQAPPNAATMSPTYPVCPKDKVISKEESETAHDRYKAGKLDYDEANYSQAISRFLAAYTIDCTKHELLVIISRAFDLAENKAEAIRALEVYLERAQLTPAEATSIRARIANMRKQLAERPPPAPTATGTTTSPAPTASAPPPTTPPPAQPEMRDHTIYPWLVVGAGGVALTAGLLVYLLRPPVPTNCEESKESCTRLPNETDAQFASDQQTAGKAVGFRIGGTVTMVGGGVLVVGGLLWHFLEPTGPKETSGARPPKRNLASGVAPVVAPGYAGLSVGGGF